MSVLHRTLLASSLLLASCGSNVACTEIGCGIDGGSFFTFTDRYDRWAAEQTSTYRFELQFDESTVVCEGLLSAEILCDRADVDVLQFTVGMEPDTWTGIDAVLIEDQFPAKVSLTITRDGGLVLQGDFDVVEQVARPNGESCEPECRFSEQALDW